MFLPLYLPKVYKSSLTVTEDASTLPRESHRSPEVLVEDGHHFHSGKRDTESQSDWQRPHPKWENILGGGSDHSFQFPNLCFTKRKLTSSPTYQFDNLCLPLCQIFKNISFEGPKTSLLIIRNYFMLNTTTYKTFKPGNYTVKDKRHFFSWKNIERCSQGRTEENHRVLLMQKNDMNLTKA